MTQLLKDFTLVKNTTKKGQMIKALKPRYLELWECYKSFSYEKEKAFKYCKELVKGYNGYWEGIVSHCINNFTYTFTFEYEGKTYKAWITKSNNYLVEL